VAAFPQFHVRERAIPSILYKETSLSENERRGGKKKTHTPRTTRERSGVTLLFECTRERERELFLGPGGH